MLGLAFHENSCPLNYRAEDLIESFVFSRFIVLKALGSFKKPGQVSVRNIFRIGLRSVWVRFWAVSPGIRLHMKHVELHVQPCWLHMQPPAIQNCGYMACSRSFDCRAVEHATWWLHVDCTCNPLVACRLHMQPVSCISSLHITRAVGQLDCQAVLGDLD